MILKRTIFNGGPVAMTCLSPYCFYLNVIAFAAVFLLLLSGCSSSSSLYEKPETSFSGVDLFPDHVKIQYARGFTVTYHGHYKVVKILSPFEKSTDTMTYVLVQRGMPAPGGYAQSQMIEIPVRSLVAMSSMHVGLVGFLGSEEILTGMGNLKYVSSGKVIERIKAGKIVEIGKDQGINEELLITMKPDLLMAIGSAVSKLNRYQSLREAGIPVMINSEWVETTPLGRAEWVKLMAVLLNREADVNRKFNAVSKQYNLLAGRAKKAVKKPGLLTGINSKDAWSVPSGNSYACKFLLDAGGSYPWAGTQATGSLQLSFETVYPHALEADYWLNVSIGTIRSKEDILSKDSRYADFKSFKTGQIYTYSKRINPQGANDYWESGAVNPHHVLADLIKILHPELLPEHELIYYQKVK